MRKIQTAEDLAKSKKRNTLVVGTILVGLMILSVAGYAFVRNPESQQETSSNITYDGSYWVLNSGGRQFYFSNNPENFSIVQTDFNISLIDLSQQRVFVASSDDYVTRELALNLQPFIGSLQQACYGPCEQDLPEKSCSDYLLIFNESTQNRVYQKDKCIFIEGDSESVDAFISRLFGFSKP